MNSVDKIKVLLVDDHTLIREGISNLLKQVSDIQIVGLLSSGEDAVNSFHTLNPNVIIMDIVMKGMSGIEATRWIKERNGQTKVILLSKEIKKEFLKAGIQSGIDGYLAKDVDKETLVNAIREVYNHRKAFSKATTSLIFDDFYKREKSNFQKSNYLKTSSLTKREQEILPPLASGKSNKEIATELLISIKTVETHKINILSKLGLKNTVELVRYAIKNGLIPL